jgi:hemerythrin
MAFIDWKESYNTGVGPIDEQHQRLVELINELHSAMKQAKSKEVIGEVISELAKYTQYHFTDEEKYMQRANYPKLLEHKKEHDDFVAHVSDYKGRFDRGEVMLSIDVLNFLQDWLVDHIEGSDQDYVSYVNG